MKIPKGISSSALHIAKNPCASLWPRLIPYVEAISLVVCICVALLSASCSGTSENPATQDDVTKTLSTITRVDDYPLYVMRYYGGYDLQGYLEAGASGEHSRGARELAHAWGCTTFAALNENGECILGRNFDWYNHMALLLYTDAPDAFASVSMVDLSYLDFTPDDSSDANLRKLLRAPFWPFDGMNEHGLAVGMMAVPHAEGGNDPKKPTIGSLAAIRVVLDHARDVDEAVSLLGRYNVDFYGGPPVHYLVSDSTHDSAVIEFIDNEMVVIRSNSPWQVATNFILTGYTWTGSPSECWRYNTAWNLLQTKNGVLNGTEAINLLASVSQPITMWSVVYGGEAGHISVSVGRKYSAVHEFTIEQLKSLR